MTYRQHTAHMRPGPSRGILAGAISMTLFILAALPLAAGGSQESANTASAAEGPLVVWTYDSFVSEWGPAAQIAQNFKDATGKEVRFVSQGDGGVLLAKAIAQGAASGADIILGLDNNLLERAIASGIFSAYKPAGSDRILEGLALDPEFRLVPWDHGSFAFIVDTAAVGTSDAVGGNGAGLPMSLEDLTDAKWQKKIILMDPRTSTPGLGFFAWVKAVYGKDWQDYWKRLEPSILTIADGWDSGYGMFTKGEAPLVLSYNTSPAYHLEYEETERFQALIFDEGHVDQIEFAGILASSKKMALAKAFMDFMLSDGFQSVIPLTNWMYPVVETEVPASFRLAPKPTRILPSKAPGTDELDEWAALFQ